MTTPRRLPHRIPTLRTSTVWPFLYTVDSEGVKQVVYDASAAEMTHLPPSASPAPHRRRIKAAPMKRRKVTLPDAPF